jgi:hypothetical protein
MRKPKALWRRRLIAALTPHRRLQVFEGDTLPDRLPTLKLALAREGDEDWSIGMYCPCGCGQRLELLVLAGVKPRWDYHLSKAGHVTLPPPSGLPPDAGPILGSDTEKSFGASSPRRMHRKRWRGLGCYMLQ